MMRSSELRQRRKERQRYKIRQVANDKLRLSVHRSNKHIYAQIIDDVSSATLVYASTLSADAKELKNGGNKDAAIFVGKAIALAAQKKGIDSVVFDRSGFLYHGRIKALAESARENGLKF